MRIKSAVDIDKDIYKYDQFADVFVHISVNNYSQSTMIPHLVLLGPRKSGTSTFGEKFGEFIDTEYFGVENNYLIGKDCIEHKVWQKMIDKEINFTDYTSQIQQMRNWVFEEININHVI